MACSSPISSERAELPEVDLQPVAGVAIKISDRLRQFLEAFDHVVNRVSVGPNPPIQKRQSVLKWRYEPHRERRGTETTATGS
jgi:hypothetical protein